MNRNIIKSKIYRSGHTMASLSEHLGFGAGDVSKSLRLPFPKVDKALAKFLGVSLHKLHPKRYSRSGKRIRGGRVRKSSTLRKILKGQKRKGVSDREAA